MESIMVELVIKGAKEIVVLDEIRFNSAEEFFRDIAIGLPPGEITVNWADGVVFLHSAFPWTEITIKEYIDHGRIYWSFVKYAPMESYKDKIPIDHVIFHVKKVKVPILIEVVKELKKRLEG
jgi:hypothetical protein